MSVGFFFRSVSGGSRLSRLLSVRWPFSALPDSLVLERLLDGDTSRSTGAIIDVEADLIKLNVDVGASFSSAFASRAWVRKGYGYCFR